MSPGPGTYKDSTTFSTLGEHKTFSAHLTEETIGLVRSAKLPGPGSYNHADVLSRGIQSSLKPNSIG